MFVCFMVRTHAHTQYGRVSLGYLQQAGKREGKQNFSLDQYLDVSISAIWTPGKYVEADVDIYLVKPEERKQDNYGEKFLIVASEVLQFKS